MVEPVGLLRRLAQRAPSWIGVTQRPGWAQALIFSQKINYTRVLARSVFREWLMYAGRDHRIQLNVWPQCVLRGDVNKVHIT